MFNRCSNIIQALVITFVLTGCMSIRPALSPLAQAVIDTVQNCDSTTMRGTGVAGDEYIICSAAQLATLASSSAQYKLGRSIDLTTEASTVPIPGFTGKLDGAGYSITGFHYANTNENYVGLFAQLTNGVEISNLKLDQFKLEGKDFVGLLAGYIDNSGGSATLISNVTITNSAVSGQMSVGMAVGLANKATFSNIKILKSTVVGDLSVGGIVGGSDELLNVIGAMIQGNVLGGYAVGGIAGYSFGSSIQYVITNEVINISDDTAQKTTGAYNLGLIGGIAGYADSGKFEKIAVMGEIVATSDAIDGVGSLFGEASSNAVTDSYVAMATVSDIQGNGAHLDAILGINDTGNSYVNSYFYNHAHSQTNHSSTMTPLTLPELAQPLNFGSFDFVNDWKISSSLQLPVFLPLDTADPFEGVGFKPNSRGAAYIYKTEDASGYSFPSASNTTTQTQTFTFQNNTGGDVYIKSAVIALGSSFTFATNPGTCSIYALAATPFNKIANGDTCTLRVKFNPVNIIANSVLSDVISVGYALSSNAGVKTEAVVKVDGSGMMAAPRIANDTFTFPDTIMGGTETDPFSFINIGNLDGEIISYTLSNPEFTISSNLCPAGTIISPTGICTLMLSFSPTAVQAYTGHLDILYRDSSNVDRTAVISLASNGLAAAPTPTPTPAPTATPAPSIVMALKGSISAGYTHACAIVDSGLKCWGSNANGRLGNNTTTSSNIPVQVTGLTTGVQMVDAGATFTCAIVNGAVKCWGANSIGQLGNNSTTESHVPVQVSGLTSGIQAISSGGGHGCAIVNGAAMCWGLNHRGQLGDGTTTNSLVPVQVTGLTSGVQAISAGDDHTCAIVNGSAKCWGRNASGQLGDGTGVNSSVPVQVSGLTSNVQNIFAGKEVGCALVSGAMKCWGSNGSYQLNDGTLINRLSPVTSSGLTSGVQDIAIGNGGMCAIVNGSLKCWGENYYGQVGDGSNANRTSPVQVNQHTSGVTSVVMGDFFTCAIANGGVKCWGYNLSGNLGNGTGNHTAEPISVYALYNGIAGITTGQGQSCAIINGGAQCWGYNGQGQLGNNSITESFTPVQVSGLTSGVQAISSSYHTCAIVNGGVKCWGPNNYGQLGNGTTVDSHVPVTVTGIAGATAISVGVDYSCAIADGGVYCWGRNNRGQLADGTGSDSSTPVQASVLTSGVTSLASGSYTACAIQNGDLLCWGNSAYINASFVPVSPLSGLATGFQSVSSSNDGDHICAIRDGGMQCWGWNNNGQLGDNTTNDAYALVQVAGLATEVQSIEAGTQHSCAVVNGGVQCWGYNGLEQLGNSGSDSLVPVSVVGITGVASLSSRFHHACAMNGAGVQCWGSNGNGQSGLDPISYVTAPVTSISFIW